MARNIRNIFKGPVTSQVVVETLVKTDQLSIQRISAKKQKLTAKAASGRKADNRFLMLLQGQLTLKDKTKFKPGDFTVLSSKAKGGPDLEAAEEDSVWLSVSINGKVGKGLFPSPDESVLKRLKQGLKRKVIIPQIDSLAETRDVRVERLTVNGNLSSLGTCELPLLNQFVLVINGRADLNVEPEVAATTGAAQGVRLLESEKISLSPGDFLVIPANTPGRVDSTQADGSTVLLSVYFGGKFQAT